MADTLLFFDRAFVFPFEAAIGRVEIPVCQITREGVKAVVIVPAAGQCKFQNNGAVFLRVQNTNPLAYRQVEFLIPRSFDDKLPTESRQLIFQPNQELMLGPFDPRDYNQNDGSGDNDYVYIDFQWGWEGDFRAEAYTIQRVSALNGPEG